MAVKYEIEYNDVVNVLHRFELYDDNYTDDPITVNGKVVLDYGEVNENLEAIRGQGLRVDLEADQSLTFEELFTENEKTFRCIYYRAGVILFQGWLNPEGFFEDYVNDKWVVSFDCIDGLGYLKDLAFVEDNGLNITGVKTQLEILSLALKRTGILVDINVDIDVFYTGLADTNSILENVKANTKRYIKDDGTTVMDCEEVIRDVLEPYGAVLTSYNGQWAIYKPNQLVSNQTATFFRYDYLGVALSPATVTFDFDFTIGSQVDGFDPHYCNGNQSFTNKPSIGAYRISYKYGLLSSLVENESMYSSDGVSVDGFLVSTALFNGVTLPGAGESGISVSVIEGSIQFQVASFYSEGSTVGIGTSFVFEFTSIIESDPPGFFGSVNTYFDIVMVDGDLFDLGEDHYVLAEDGVTWNITSITPETMPTIFSNKRSVGYSATISQEINNAPIDGELYVVINRPWLEGVNPSIDFSLLSTNFAIRQSDSQTNNIEGEIHTFERTVNPSSRIPKTKQVLTGDSDLDIYQGTLYKADGTTPTSTWYRKGVAEAEPILSIMGAETMRMNQNTMRIFSGDVFGYFNYLSVITIDGRAGKFGVTKYSYDTYSNVISMTIKQMFSAELTDLEIDTQLDYGNVVEPTIKG